MIRTLLATLTLTAALWAQMTLYPAKTCDLYDNLKHTKNTHALRVDMHRSYTMVRHHKGQYLVKIENEQPSQRWVDDDCLTLRPLRGTPLYERSHTPEEASNEAHTNAPKPLAPETRTGHTVSEANLLTLSWQNAFCETHRRAKECRKSLRSLWARKGELTLHGLWPQPRRKVYCNVPKRYIAADKRGEWYKLPEPKLTPQTRKALETVMPAAATAFLHRHEWIKHGTCYGTDAESYFADAIRLSEAVRHSEVARLFKDNVGKRLTLERIRRTVERSFGNGTGEKAAIVCQRGMITELRFSIGDARGDMHTALRSGKPIRGRCRYGIVDRPGYGR